MPGSRETEVAIIGGGIAGSLVACMLEKSGTEYVVIDPRSEYPDEFRCEKFNAEQITLLRQTGVADRMFEAITPVSDVWMARFGRLVRKQNYPHYGFSYQTAVNALRKDFADSSRFIQGTVADVKTTPEKQCVYLTDNRVVDARLVILASGANRELQTKLGFHQTMLSERHCLAIGFDVKPAAGSEFPFDTMTYWPENASEQMSYLTFFRCGEGWRANLFGYWSIRDDRIRQLKTEPEACLHALMPGLEKITGKFSIPGKLRVRPIDLYQWNANMLDGIVAIGDAWSSSCPGAGTGTTKAINDALQLCKTHVPEWLATPGMPSGKITAFYRDAEKLKVDQASLSEAFKLRSLTLENGLYWNMQRWARFIYHGTRGRFAAG